MTPVERIDRLCGSVVCCSPVKNPAERVVVARGTIEAMGHILDPGCNTDARAFRQGWDWLCIETGGKELPQRYRLLFAAGFWGVIATWRAHAALSREAVR
ncbi:hypothetical protein [Burkholderia glumae]|uniref:hypothetical protein n=1 Tax=Burkholderia glumae TaxID=337 RepID=UPI0015715EAD|nr:hypothetical protein [Burkholderia glumae]NVE22366.1 hypothetical protein [Burkholderia glumae]QKM53736.1 hypothetical protein CG017_01753 [Burkholderia glumae]